MKDTIKMQGQRNRYFLIAEILLAVSPLMCLAYFSVGNGPASFTPSDFISANPAAAVTFLAAMLNPFAAYLLDYSRKRMVLGDEAYALVTLIGITAVEAILMNVAYTVMMTALFFYVKKSCNTSIRSLRKEYTVARLLVNLSGCLAMAPIAALCMFAQLRLA
ncbi:hypothetical protein [Clostridium sp. AM58-1XD]|uniref:hypothetical protein n=1 Tax=Clostridium sp. AM58-1XD TaxID=2292307 RepID=UPI000E4E60AB|nr:hypothetical protein [Clostridium sp. AM58-1XD]RGZ00976.1 hypothetical protein DXA13_03670 [Clostridium sp. AM58-1XD]